MGHSFTPQIEGSTIKYTETNYNTLVSNVSSQEIGDIAEVISSTGTWLLGTLKAEGFYRWDGSSWVYKGKTLQDAISDNIDEISSNDAEILALQTDVSRLKLIEENQGMIQFSDSQYTDANRLQLTSDVPTAIPNNKNSILNLSAPLIASNWMDANGNLTPEKGNGDSWILRVTFLVDPTLNNRNLVCDLGIPNSIWNETKRLARGAGIDTPVSIILPYYTLGTFFANGGTLSITCDSDAEAWNFVHVLQRTKYIPL